MAVTYKNFRGDMYYLHSRITKKGNTTYHFSKKREGADVKEIPEGYEIYENPNGRVFLRKIPTQLINENEIKTIEEAMKNYCSIKDFKLDVKKDTIYIYTVETDLNDLPFLTGVNVNKYKNYETVMRFRLVDEKSRKFVVDRFMFLGDIDDWWELDYSTNLVELAKEFVPHIGQESFYELI